MHLALTLAFGLACGITPLHAQSRHGGERGYRSFRSVRYASAATPHGIARVQQAPAPIERRPPPSTQRSAASPSAQEHSQLAPIEHRNSPGHGPKGEHLAQWMSQHSNLSPQQQQQALEREPGFRQLPAQTQQRMRNRLAQLDAMSPQQRQRVLSHTEMIERMTPDQRTQFRGAMQELGSLPPDQRHAVARSFRDLRELPPDQRLAAVNSPRYNWMNPAQRATMMNLLRIEPLLPPPGR